MGEYVDRLIEVVSGSVASTKMNIESCARISTLLNWRPLIPSTFIRNVLLGSSLNVIWLMLSPLLWRL